jgi:carbon monoxide dehydrogenase subunit G
MAKVERNITISTPVEKVFSYITNPENQLEWLPGITDIRDIRGQGVGQKFGFTYKMMGISFKGESETLEVLPNERIVEKSSGGIVSTWTWTFKSEPGRTNINLVVEYDIPIPVLGKFAERMALKQTEREADHAVSNLQDILEG